MKKYLLLFALLIATLSMSCDNGMLNNPDTRLFGTWYDSTYNSTVHLIDDGTFENINYLGDSGTWEYLGDTLRFKVSASSAFNPSITFDEKYRLQSDDVLIFEYEHPTDSNLDEDFVFNRIP